LCHSLVLLTLNSIIDITNINNSATINSSHLMIHSLQNDILSVAISTKGAELQSIIHKDFGLEYMWSGDPKFWGKKSPVLFPIVGGLKSNSYQYKGKSYQLNRHGFARDMEFEITEQDKERIVFTINGNEETFIRYPFQFSFSAGYKLDSNRLSVTYIIRNTGKEEMLFSVGGHPAFKVPLVDGTIFEDYFLEFNHFENASRWPLSKDGLIEGTPIQVIEHTDRLPLKKSLFYEDALVFKHLVSKSIYILSNKTSHGLKLNFAGFPYLGIWNAKDANFVCIEPWCGIADSVNTTANLADKEGINILAPGMSFDRTWHVELF
jgi:galactose mutarotase-like enzyme